MQKFTEIGQFRNVIREVKTNFDYQGKDENGDAIYKHVMSYPKYLFRGTVKNHGTNAAIACYRDDYHGAERSYEFQSRENVLSVEKDNSNFMKTMLKLDYQSLFDGIMFTNSCLIYGEWCGCFSYQTPILLADGTNMPIGKIVNQKLDVEVLSYNFDSGKIEPKKIINWYNNGKTDEWLKIGVRRRKRGGKSTGLTVTANHKIFVNENNQIVEKFANEIKFNDKVLIYGNVITHNVKQFLMGTLLGDGSFSSKRNIVVSHSEDSQKFYNEFIINVLNNIISSTKESISGHGSNMKTIYFKAFPEIEELYDELYYNGISKQVTTNYLNKLSPIALATWYMDDGSIILHNGNYRQYQCTLHCQGFGKENVILIADWFNSKGYSCYTINNHDKDTEIRFTVEGSASFLYVISPYIIKEFNYKLPPILLEVEKISWWNHYLSEYDYSLIETTVTSVERYYPPKEYLKIRYDIKIEDNSNYFANNILVHNSGIQKKVAITQLPKMFIIFAIKIDGVYQDMINFKHIKNEEQRIYNILDFPHYFIEIDFNFPEKVQNELVDLTMAVEKECPVGKQLGAIGIGEGIVWEYINGDKRYIFKVKGEKHQNSKVKTLTTVDVEEIENMNSFVEYAVTENRLLQGIDKMKELGLPIEEKTTGDYIRWVFNDVIKEESDTIAENGIDPKKIGKAVSTKARQWWLNYLNTNL